MSFEPLLPLPLWLALAAAAVALLCAYAWKRPVGIRRRRWFGILALMSAGVVLLLIILLNPTWSEPINPPQGKPLLTILVDATASMATPDVGSGQTRYQSAVARARSFATDLEPWFQVRVQQFADVPVAVDLDALDKRLPEGEVTDLAAALTGNLQGEHPQGQTLVLLSDGIHNGEGGPASVVAAARLARALLSPVYTHTLGGHTVVKDLAVELRAPQELAYIGQRIPVDVLLRQRGLAGARAILALVQQDQVVDRQEIVLSQKQDVTVRFWIQRDQPGLYRFEVRAEPIPGEVSLANNSATLLLRVVDEPIRVLVLEGKPYWDAKFFLRTLSADPSIALDSVVRVTGRRFLHRAIHSGQGRAASAEGRGVGVPASAGSSRNSNASLLAPNPSPPKVDAGTGREDWKILTNFGEFLSNPAGLRSYQIIVLGRDAEAFLTEPVLAQLRGWLAQDGGSLVCYRGQPQAEVGQRLGQLLPVRWTPAREYRFRVSLTERGRDLHWLSAANEAADQDPLARLPTLAAVSRSGQPAPLATVLATAHGATEEEPAVTYQTYGSGRTVVIEGAGMWRWAFLPPEQKQQDEVYRSLWHSLLRWLVSNADLLPGQKLALRSDKVSFRASEPATATLLIRDDAANRARPVVEVRSRALGQPRSVLAVPLGEEPGTYRVSFGKLPEGRYAAQVTAPADSGPAGTTVFDVRSLSEEHLDLQVRPELMERIARESGGAVLTGSSPAELVRAFREHFEQYRALQVRQRPAWDRWWVLLGVLALWGTAWAVRRSGGLI